MADKVVSVARESGEVGARRLLLIIGGWFVFVFLVLGILLRIGDSRSLPPPDAAVYPAPRLVAQPEAELNAYLRDQRKRLDSPDKSHPSIERAMDAIARRDDPYAPLTPSEAEVSP